MTAPQKPSVENPSQERVDSLTAALNSIRAVEHALIGIGFPGTVRRVAKVRTRITMHLEKELFDSGAAAVKREPLDSANPSRAGALS